MRPIGFSGTEDAVAVQRPNGTHVNYHIFEESEIHLNWIASESVQEWHYHTRISECPLITKGMLICRWLEGGVGRTRKVCEQEIVRVGSSVHTFANESKEDMELVVFRFVPDDKDKRETTKSDKVVVDR